MFVVFSRSFVSMGNFVCVSIDYPTVVAVPNSGSSTYEFFTSKSSDAILPPQGHWIEDSKKIGPKMQEKALRFSWALG